MRIVPLPANLSQNLPQAKHELLVVTQYTQLQVASFHLCVANGGRILIQASGHSGRCDSAFWKRPAG